MPKLTPLKDLPNNSEFRMNGAKMKKLRSNIMKETTTVNCGGAVLTYGSCVLVEPIIEG